MKQLIFLLGFMILGSGTTLLGAGSENDSLSISFEAVGMKMFKVKGTISGFKGEVDFNPSDLGNSFFRVCIDATTIQSGYKKRDDHLNSEDFLNTGKYPSICFESSSIEKLDKGFVTRRSLSMIGNTYDFEIPFTYEDGWLRGTVTLNRLEYNLGENVGTFKASEEIQVHIAYRQ